MLRVFRFSPVYRLVYRFSLWNSSIKFGLLDLKSPFLSMTYFMVLTTRSDLDISEPVSDLSDPRNCWLISLYYLSSDIISLFWPLRFIFSWLCKNIYCVEPNRCCEELWWRRPDRGGDLYPAVDDLLRIGGSKAVLTFYSSTPPNYEMIIVRKKASLSIIFSCWSMSWESL